MEQPEADFSVGLNRIRFNRKVWDVLTRACLPLSAVLIYLGVRRETESIPILGILFLFNSTTKLFHYDGASWKEIVSKFAASPEAAEAQKRLDSLKLKMEKPTAK